MSRAYLEVTYHKGRPQAAYYWLPRRAGDVSARTEDHGMMLIDWTANGRAIGIELTSPAEVNLAQLNQVLMRIHQQPVLQEDLRPLARSA